MPLPPDTGDLIVEDIYFPAGPRRLHGELVYAEVGDALGAVVLAGPHPLMGGTLQNNVVRGLGDGLARRRLLTLRFDYRGVGRSEGPPLEVSQHFAKFSKTAQIPGELALGDDVQAAAEHVRHMLGPHLPVALVGYGFGCALLPRVRLMGPLPALALVAPAVARHGYESYLALENPKLVIAAEDDFAAEAGPLRPWFERLAAPRYLVLQRFDHPSLRGYEDWLAETVFGFLLEQWR